MTLQKFIAKLNWRQVAIHFIATWFFMYSFQTLATLYHTNIIDIYRHSDKGNLAKALSENRISASGLADFTVWISLGNTVGLSVAFIISLTISIRKKWFWFNSFIVLILVYVLSWFEFLGWQYLKNIFLAPGEIFRNTTLEFLTNGTILLSLGLLTFFLSKTNKFIAIGSRTTV